MKIERLVVGQLQTDCYLVSCLETGKAVIIDPGGEGDFISQKILDLKLEPVFILATHGHFDHVLGVAELKLAFDIPFLMHEKDLFLLKRTKETAEYFLGPGACPEIPGKLDLSSLADSFIKEGDVIKFGREKLEVIETPGHSPGGVSFYGFTDVPADSPTLRVRGFKPEGFSSAGSGVLFSGDTLFCQGIGRTDFSYASSEDLEESLKKLLELPDETAVYPGHGPETTIGAERPLYPSVV